MNLITSLLVLLICSRICGKIFKAFGQQEVLGEIVGGLLVGTLTTLVTPNEALNAIIELAIFLLIFAAGLEMDLKDIFSAIRKKALICAPISFAISFGAGTLLSTMFDLNLTSSMVVGLCFAITAMPVAVSFLKEAQILDKPLGNLIMGSVVIMDVVALLFLGITFDMESTKTTLEFVQIFAIKTFKMACFFMAVMLVNKFLRSEISRANKVEKTFKKIIDYLGKEAVFGIGVVFVLGFSTFSEALGFHFIIGAFFGGLLLNKDIIGTPAFLSMNKTLGAVTNHFLTPIFFAYIGLHFSLEAFNEWDVLLMMMAVAFGAKILGSWLGGRMAKLNNKESLQLGITLNSRGSLDLIVANLAFSKGYLPADIFSILIFLGVSSAIINPILYRRLISSVPTEEN